MENYPLYEQIVPWNRVRYVFSAAEAIRVAQKLHLLEQEGAVIDGSSPLDKKLRTLLEQAREKTASLPEPEKRRQSLELNFRAGYYTN